MSKAKEGNIMLVTEDVKIGESDFVHNYSDANKYIKKVGTDEKYVEAYDPVGFKEERKYEETDEEIPLPPETDEANEIAPQIEG